MYFSPMFLIYSICIWTFRIAFVGWIATFFLTDRMPPTHRIAQELQNPPFQSETEAEQFEFEYQDQTNNVVPMAEYNIWGLVVSHNDPGKWYSFDLTNDEKSLNTRDLCIIWGKNAQFGDYDKIDFHNDDYYCGWKYGKDVKYFNNEEISNNHLITDNPKIRKLIDKVRVGDQIHIKGKLVNYSEERWNGKLRNTSLTRTDKGMGACEIVYVEDMHIIDSYNYIWALINSICFWAAIVAVSLRFILFWIIF